MTARLIWLSLLPPIHSCIFLSFWGFGLGGGRWEETGSSICSLTHRSVDGYREKRTQNSILVCFRDLFTGFSKKIFQPSMPFLYFCLERLSLMLISSFTRAMTCQILLIFQIYSDVNLTFSPFELCFVFYSLFYRSWRIGTIGTNRQEWISCKYINHFSY